MEPILRKVKRIMLEAFVSKSILHVYQNAKRKEKKREKKKTSPKIIQNLILKNFFFA
jgi:hypothetical protein